MIRHLSQSVSGALNSWTEQTWHRLAQDNGCSVKEAKEFFEAAQKEGKKVLPSSDCDNFDYEKGCLGHESLGATGASDE